MTPITSIITYTQEYRLIFSFGPGEGFFAPGIPVYRIISLLQQVAIQLRALADKGLAS